MPPITIHRILVAMDFSPSAKSALDYALSMAERYEADIRLLHVIEQRTLLHLPQAPSSTSSHAVEEAAARELKKLTERFKSGGVRMRTAVRSGEAYREICAAAEEDGVDLIVMGTQGHSGLPRVLLGSTAERVVRSAPVPVLTVHAEPEAPSE